MERRWETRVVLEDQPLVERTFHDTRREADRGSRRLADELRSKGFEARQIRVRESGLRYLLETPTGAKGHISVIPALGEPPPAPPEPGVVVLRAQRRLVLPEAVCEYLGVRQGDRIVFSCDAGREVRLASARTVAENAVGMLAHIAPGRRLSDELIADRREEARREAVD